MDETIGIKKELMKAYSDSLDSEDEFFNAPLEVLQSTFYNFKNLVEDLSFFETRKDLIMNIYKAIKSKEYTTKIIKNIPDINYLVHEYKEYYKGMMEYLNDILKKLTEDDNKEDYDELTLKFSMLIDKDETYIESLKNPSDVSFNDGVTYIETMIDLNELGPEFISDLDRIMSQMIKNQNQLDKLKVMKCIFSLVLSSTRNFYSCVRCKIFNLVNEYEGINDSNTEKCYDRSDKPKLV